MQTILMIDDDNYLLNEYRSHLGDTWNVITANSVREGISILEEKKPEILLLDITISRDKEGLDALPVIKKRFPDLLVVMVTNMDMHTVAEEAVEKGADDFFVKSGDLSELRLMLQDLIIRKGIEEYKTEGPLVISQNTKQVFSEAGKAAKSSIAVLISGETGTGKELLARFIHENSPHREKPLYTLNSPAIPVNLFESELFGHVKGAFTGAVGDKKGLFELADNSTLFLDEIADLPLEAQAKLLRVLENGEFSPVGGSQIKRSSPRIIAATNSSLSEAVKNGSFREDLYYRLSGIELELPPLRKRREEILPLAYHFLAGFCEEEKRKVPRFAKNTLRFLQCYDWPGNIRELKKSVRRASILCTGNIIRLSDFKIFNSNAIPKTPAPYEMARDEALQRFQEQYIRDALLQNGGNISATADEIGISRQALQKMLKKLKIKVR